MSRRPARGSPAHCDTERGSTTVFTLGLVIVVLLLITVTTTAAAVHLERKRLWNLTDALTLEISDALSFEAHLGHPLDTGRVRDILGDALTDGSAHGPPDGLIVLGENTGFTPPDVVTVHLEATHRPGPLPWILAPWTDGIGIAAEARTRITVPD